MRPAWSTRTVARASAGTVTVPNTADASSLANASPSVRTTRGALVVFSHVTRSPAPATTHAGAAPDSPRAMVDVRTAVAVPHGPVGPFGTARERSVGTAAPGDALASCDGAGAQRVASSAMAPCASAAGAGNGRIGPSAQTRTPRHARQTPPARDAFQALPIVPSVRTRRRQRRARATSIGPPAGTNGTPSATGEGSLGSESWRAVRAPVGTAVRA